jgi:hypothetical protein
MTGQNFEVFQGDTKDIFIDVVDENGAALDLSSYDAIHWVAYKPTTKEEILSKTLGSGITVPSLGVIKISLVPADTEILTPLIYAHECEISDGTNVVSTVCTGTMKVIYSKA